MNPTRFFLGILAYGLLIPFSANAASVLFLQDFELHDRDKEIVSMMGYSEGAIVYWKEMASISQDKYNTNKSYESIGCYPFYMMRNGLQEEFGLNCRSFVCSGYRKGTVQCQNREGKAMGGEVEIQRRKAKKARNESMIGPKYFEQFPAEEQTAPMKERMTKMATARCKPFYLVEFDDVVVGDGYACEEVGQYPYYSGAFACTDDWRMAGGMKCNQNIRSDEFEVRLKAISSRATEAIRIGSGVTKKADAESYVDSRTGSAVLGEANQQEEESMMPTITFVDLDVSHPAYESIRVLVARNVLKGYDDGSFKPQRTVNRAEFLKMLFSSLKREELKDEQSCFPDVIREWFSASICAAKRLEWVKGYSSGLFYPEKTVSRSEAIKMLMRALADERTEGTLPEDVTGEAWYAPAVRAALARGIIEDIPFYPDGELTRAEAAMWVAKALSE